MLRSLAAAALAGALLLPATAVAAPGDLLFVQSSAAARLVPTGDDRLRLVLPAADRTVTTFTDRPARVAGRESLRAFVRSWTERGFDDVPPNAALVVDRARRGADTLILELRDPRLRNGRLVYDAQRIDPPADGPLAAHGARADERVARRLGRVHLFIDDAPSRQDVELTLAMRQAGRVAVTFDAGTTVIVGPGEQGATWVGNAGGGFITSSIASVTFAQVQGAIGGELDFTVLAGPGPITGSVAYDQGGAGATLQVGDDTPQPLPAGPFSIPVS